MNGQSPIPLVPSAWIAQIELRQLPQADAAIEAEYAWWIGGEIAAWIVDTRTERAQLAAMLPKSSQITLAKDLPR